MKYDNSERIFNTFFHCLFISEHAKLVEESSNRQQMLNESRKAQKIENSEQNSVVKHELIFPLKNSTRPGFNQFIYF